MATQAVTPAAPAAPPVSSESVSSTPAVETPSSTPAAPATPEPISYKAGESDQELLARITREKAEKTAQPATPATPATEVAQPATPVEKKTEPAQPETPPAEPADLDDEQKEMLAQLETELMAGEEVEGVLSPKALAEHADLKPILEKNPEFKGQLMKTARLASEAVKYQEIFTTPEQAAEANELATAYGPIRDSFQSIQKPEDARSVLEQIAKQSLMVDEAGNPVTGPDGKQLVHESFAHFLDGVYTHVANYSIQQMQRSGQVPAEVLPLLNAALDVQRAQLQKEVAKGGDEAEDAQGLLAALDTLKERISPARSQASEEIPEHVKQRLADIEQREQKLARDQQQARQQEQVAFEEKFETTVDQRLNPLMDRLLEKMDVPDFNRETAKARIAEALAERLLANQHYVRAARSLKGQGISDDVLKQRVALAMRNVQEILADVARPIINEAKGSFKKSQDAKSAKLASQIDASKSEPKGGTAVPTPPPVPKKHELLPEFRRQYKAQTGDVPSDREEMAFLTDRPINGFKWQTSA